MVKKVWENLLNFFSDEENPNEPIYDPVHFAAMIILVLFASGVLFWLFWTLLVFGGGIFPKIVPAIQVLFTSKQLKDFGWEGYPYELGIFEGFIGNGVALFLTIALVGGIWWLFEGTQIYSNDELETDSSSDSEDSSGQSKNDNL